MRHVVLLLACLSSTAYADKPLDRAKAFLAGQVEAIRKDDTPAFVATFTADAVMTGGYSDQPVHELEHFDARDAFLDGSPHSVFKKIAIKSLTAGGTADVVWLTAELAATYNNHELEGSLIRNAVRVTRLTELVVRDGSSWKVVAAALAYPLPSVSNIHPEHNKIANPTKPGPLVPLIASPAELAKKLATDNNLVVLGTDTNERAVGPAAARRMLGRWTKLGLTIDTAAVRERRTATYGFAQASVRFTAKASYDKNQTLYYNMQALLIALPAGPGDWRVVVVHYVNDSN